MSGLRDLQDRSQSRKRISSRPPRCRHIAPYRECTGSSGQPLRLDMSALTPYVAHNFRSARPTDQLQPIFIRSHHMKFVKVQDEERPGEVAINLDLVREAHFGGGLLRIYFERGASQDRSNPGPRNSPCVPVLTGSS